MENNQVFKQSLTTEKPKYLKASNGLVLELIKPIDNSTFKARVVYAGNSTHDVDKISGWYFAEFEPCDYTEPVEVPKHKSEDEKLADALKWKDAYKSHLDEGGEIILGLLNQLTNCKARIAELEAQLAAKNELLSNTEQLPIGTIVHIVIEFANKKGYRMLHISEPNYTCKKAFEWAHNQAEIVEGIITSYNYISQPIKQ